MTVPAAQNSLRLRAIFCSQRQPGRLAITHFRAGRSITSRCCAQRHVIRAALQRAKLKTAKLVERRAAQEARSSWLPSLPQRSSLAAVLTVMDTGPMSSGPDLAGEHVAAVGAHDPQVHVVTFGVEHQVPLAA